MPTGATRSGWGARIPTFKCTAAGYGNDALPDFRGSASSHFIATTVELLTTGVDVPAVRNIAFFRYMKSPISFYQMIGRGTRIDEPTGNLMFTVYDDTGATRLFGLPFVSSPKGPEGPPGTGGGGGPEPPPPIPPVIEWQRLISSALQHRRTQTTPPARDRR